MAASIILETHSPEETMGLGRKLGAQLKSRDVVCLVGSVGAGKTTFIQGMAQGIGVKHSAQSPTFVLAHEYQGRIKLTHFDFFRLGPNEILSTGWEDYLQGPGAVVAEWADIGQALWPSFYLEIKVESFGENDRRFVFSPQGTRYEKLISALRGFHAPCGH